MPVRFDLSGEQLADLESIQGLSRKVFDAILKRLDSEHKSGLTITDLRAVITEAISSSKVGRGQRSQGRPMHCFASL